mgnify:CR=1 FL=1
MYTFHPHARILAVCLAGMLSIVVAGGAADVPPVEPVVDAGASDAGELPAVPDHGLQQALEQLVREQGLWSQVESRKLALGLVDITDIDAPRYAALNPDHMMYAASLPKIAILLGAYVEVTEGDLQLEEGLHEDMVRMIRYSDNASATRVLEKVGREDLIDILTSERLRLYDPAHNGGLWVGKDYARQNAFRRDPLHNLSHGATVYQVARFFYLLEKGDLVDDAYRDEMKEILSKPGIEPKFVAGLRNRPVTEMYRKSGTWRQYHADAALVEAGGHRFIMVGLAQHPDGGKWLTRLAAPMHDLVVGGEAAGAGDEEPDDEQ